MWENYLLCPLSLEFIFCSLHTGADLARYEICPDVRLTPVFVIVHFLRWNIREKFKLLSDLKDFESWLILDNLGIWSQSDRSSVSLAARPQHLQHLQHGKPVISPGHQMSSGPGESLLSNSLWPELCPQRHCEVVRKQLGREAPWRPAMTSHAEQPLYSLNSLNCLVVLLWLIRVNSLRIHGVLTGFG